MQADGSSIAVAGTGFGAIITLLAQAIVDICHDEPTRAEAPQQSQVVNVEVGTDALPWPLPLQRSSLRVGRC